MRTMNHDFHILGRAKVGTVRNGRGQPALAPASAPVDGRDLPQLICQVGEFARLFSYIGPEGGPDGDWRPFFERDLSFLLARILCFDGDAELAVAAARRHAPSEGQRRDVALLGQLSGLIEQVSGWALCARELGAPDILGTPLSLTLEALISEKLAPVYQAMLAHPTWAPVLLRLQENFLSQHATDHAWLKRLWHGLGGEPERASAADLNTAHLSFVSQIMAVMATFRSYFDHALHDTFGHQPHSALLLTFLRLLRHAQDDANAVTGRHLDFYYRQVLRLQQRAPQPDRALLSFRPSPTGGAALLPAATLLKAGKLANGQDLLYAVDGDLVVNRDTVAALKTVHATPGAPLWRGGPAGVSRIYATPQADSEDGLGAPLSEPRQGWPTFGRDWERNPRVPDSAPPAQVGVLLTSPMLLLKGGRRLLRVRLQFQPEADAVAGAGAHGPSAAAFASVAEAYYNAVQAAMAEYGSGPRDAMARRALSSACEVWLTTAQGWHRVAKVRVHGDPRQAWIELGLLLPASFPPVLAGPPTPGEAGGDGLWPRMKIMLSPAAQVYPYAYLQQLRMQSITLRACVTGLAPASMRYEQKPLRAGQPLFPFGHAPALGGTLDLSDPELAGKPVLRAAMRIAWLNLPAAPDGLTRRYAAYNPPHPAPAIYNSSFRVQAQVLCAGRWRTAGHPLPLFTASFDNDAALQTSVSLPLAWCDVLPRPWDGVRLQLAAPASGFGQELYPQLAVAAALNAAVVLSQNVADRVAAGARTVAPPPVIAPPAPPFVPQAQQITLSYLAREQLQAELAPDPASDTVPCFYQLGPFGYRAAPLDGQPLLPGLEVHGQLYIGLRQVVPGQIVSLLFGMRETAAQQRAVRRGWPGAIGAASEPDAAVTWCYLFNNEWQPFKSHRLLSDSTGHLTRSGIVRLQTEVNCLDGENTLLPPGLLWIAALARHAQLHSHVTLIDTQGATATQMLMGLTPQASGSLPANSILGFANKPRGMQSVTQALRTQGGQGAEGADDFLVRVSRRLRHKQRAVRAVDFEQLVLDLCSDVFQAKCITPAMADRHAYPGAVAVPPGTLGLVLAPQPAQTTAQAALPSVPVARLWQIRDLLLSHCAASVRQLLVFSPQYEELKVCLRLTPGSGTDFSFLQQVLNDAIDAWIAPWRSQPGAALSIGGDGRSFNELHVFLASLAGVAQLDELKLLHVYESGGERAARWLGPNDALAPSTPWSVLVPAKRHFITNQADLCYGIGQMAVGSDVMSMAAAVRDGRYTALRNHASAEAAIEQPGRVQLALSKLPHS